jgi:hypothetical protein
VPIDEPAGDDVGAVGNVIVDIGVVTGVVVIGDVFHELANGGLLPIGIKRKTIITVVMMIKAPNTDLRGDNFGCTISDKAINAAPIGMSPIILPSGKAKLSSPLHYRTEKVC